MSRRVERTGTVSVALPPDEAFPLFTPEGERSWVSGWAPTYPAGGRPDPAPGVAFVLGKEAGASTWLVTRYDAAARGASYAYVLPEHRAVLVDVDVEAGPGGGSRARVAYRMTSLGPAGDAFVREFGEGWDAFLAGWEEGIRRHVVEGEPLPGA